jgi:TRAP-type uncharacterized transport system substrate-binding protein
VASLLDLLGLTRATTTWLVAGSLFLLIGAIGFSIWSEPPRTITITTGPLGSGFHTSAVRYAEILAGHHVKLKILESRGSLENLQRLSDPKFKVDIGYVLGGVTNQSMDKLVSLGSVAYQPLLIFYRGNQMELLSELAGKRLAIGAEGSGTRNLSLVLLQTNGITSANAKLLDWPADQSAKALMEGRADAVFLMGEDAPISLIKQLLQTPGVHLFSFKQAVAYTRRIPYLNVLEIPEGSLDLGKDVPANDIYLIGPTVELIARDTLHPALSDLLLEAAQKVHGKASILQRKGEFPAPLEHDFPISAAAARFYKSGKMLFYRYLPFWLAALISRMLVVFLPMVLVMIPIVRSAPRIYTWRVRSRVYRWYRALQALEKEALLEERLDRRQELIKRLDDIEKAVNRLKVPAFAADLYYDLRGHIRFVRQLLERELLPFGPEPRVPAAGQRP